MLAIQPGVRVIQKLVHNPLPPGQVASNGFQDALDGACVLHPAVRIAGVVPGLPLPSKVVGQLALVPPRRARLALCLEWV